MLNDKMVKAAFATGDRLQVNAGFEQARQIVVYEVSTTGARECHAMTYQSGSPKGAGPTATLGRNGKGGPGVGGGCGGGKKKEILKKFTFFIINRHRRQLTCLLVSAYYR